MRMVFIGADHEEFAEAAQRVLAEFEAWAETRGRAVDLFVADAVLDQRYHSDGLLGRWTVRALRDLLLIWFPRKVTLVESERAAVPATVEAFLDFLDDSDLLDERGEPIGVLRGVLHDITPGYFTAMREPENFGLAKFWATKMLESGVDPEDDEEASEFIGRVRAGEIAVDEEVLSVIAERLQDGDPDLPAQAPAAVFDLPAEARQRELAGNTTIVAQLRAFVNWVGDGRALTAKGNLKLADARHLVALLETHDEFDVDVGGVVFHTRTSESLPGISGVFDVAKAIRVVRVVKGRLLKVKGAAGLLADSLRLWQAAFDQMDLLETAQYSLFPIEDDLVFPILAGLFASPIPLPAPILLTMLDETSALPVVDNRLDRQTRILADFGLVGSHEATDEERLELEDFLAAQDVEPGGWSSQIFELLPLGRRALRELFAESGIPVVDVEDLAGETAEVLAARLVEMPPETFDKGVAGWLAARESKQACAELRALAARTDDAGHRMIAFRLLSACGADGTATMLSLRAHPMAGPSAAGWLVSAGVLAGEELSRREVVFGMLDALSAVPEEAASEFARQPREAQLDLIEEIPAAGHPRAIQILESIAAEHQDKAIAKAARKALFRLGSRH